MQRKLTQLSLIIILSLLLLSTSYNGFAQNNTSFNHPGLLNNTSELQFIKLKIASGEQPWKGAYDALKSKISLSYKPSPRTILPNDANVQDVMTTDGSTAYAFALIWYFSGDSRYASKSIEILNAWSVFSSHPNWLYLSWAVPQFLNAAEIMRHTTNSGWSTTSIQKFNTMVRAKFLPAMKNQTWVNNAMMSTIEGQIACSIYLDDRAEFNTAIQRWRDWIPNYIYITTDGPKPKLVGRTTIGYWGTGANEQFINGACQETCRDLNHAKMGTYSLMYGAEMAWHQNIDLWSEQKERFISFAELHAGWMIGATKVPTWMCNKEGIWCQGQVSWGSPSGHPPCNPASWELIKNHYVTRLGLGSRLPLTVKMTIDQRPNGSINDRNGKFNTLTHANLVYSATTAAPEINVKQGATNINSYTGTFVHQASTLAGAISAPISFTIQNTGNGPLSVSAITLSGTDASQFIVSDASLKSVSGPTGTTTFTVTFHPTSIGTKSVTVSIINNDSNENPYTFTIRGISTSPNLDCAGVAGGSAFIDGCGICAGGTTGRTPTNPTTWYQDSDGDGHGDAAQTVSACTKPTGYVAIAGDACPTNPAKIIPGKCGCNIAETNCGTTDTASILGPDCGKPLQTLNYSINPIKRANAVSHSWWVSGGGQAITSADGNSSSITLSQYFTNGKVCVGIKLDKSPYYVQYCKLINECGAKIVFGETIDEISEKESNTLVIYPNPANADHIVVDAAGFKSIPEKILLINNYGEVVLETKNTGVQTTLSIVNLPLGSYTLKAHFKNISCNQKLMIVQ